MFHVTVREMNESWCIIAYANDGVICGKDELKRGIEKEGE